MAPASQPVRADERDSSQRGRTSQRGRNSQPVGAGERGTSQRGRNSQPVGAGERGNSQRGRNSQPATDTQPLSDEVDEIVARWQSERPDLDVSPLQVLSRVSRLARHLDRARRAAFAAHGLETWEFDVLTALRRQGPPYQLSPGALVRATLVTSGTMTNRIDRLAAAGLVNRRRDPEDKRGVLVQLTGDGLRTVDAAFAALLAGEETLLTGLDANQQDQLAGLLRILLAPFDAGESGRS